MILHQSTMKELAPLLAAALVLCVAAACADRRRQLFWGRSLGVKLLPLFVVLGMARGFGEEHIVLAEHKAAKAAFDEAGLQKLPKVKELDAEFAELLTKKKASYPDYRKARNEMQELVRAQKNVERFFAEEKTVQENEQTR